MNILVTGGAGFVGTNLIKHLLQEGHKVTSLDNYTTGLKENEISNENVTYSNGDIRDLINHSKYYFRKFDIVISHGSSSSYTTIIRKPSRVFSN